MLVTRDPTRWLDQVDPWSENEALDLLRALQICGPAGIYECAATADGGHCFLLAPHAESVLQLSNAQERGALIDLLCERFGHQPVLTAAANESRPMQLHDLPQRAVH